MYKFLGGPLHVVFERRLLPVSCCGSLLAFFLDLEDGGNTFFQNVG
jgi:hypothetical protein